MYHRVPRDARGPRAGSIGSTHACRTGSSPPGQLSLENAWVGSRRGTDVRPWTAPTTGSTCVVRRPGTRGRACGRSVMLPLASLRGSDGSSTSCGRRTTASSPTVSRRGLRACAAPCPDTMIPSSAAPTTISAVRSIGMIVMQSSAATRVPRRKRLEVAGDVVRAASAVGTRGGIFVHGARSITAHRPRSRRGPHRVRSWDTWRSFVHGARSICRASSAAAGAAGRATNRSSCRCRGSRCRCRCTTCSPGCSCCRRG